YPRRFDHTSVRRPEVTGADEAGWVQAVAARGDRAAFAQLFRRYAPKIKAHVVARGAAAASADELTQEGMLIVWRKASLYDPARGSGAAWLYTISRNFRVNQARAGRRREESWAPEDAFPEPEPQPTSEQALMAAEQRRSLTISLGELPREQRDILE